MKVLSYNLLKNKASKELDTLVNAHNLDVLCLQEVETKNLPKHLENLELAISTDSNRLGLAVYVNTETHSIKDVESFSLKKSVYDLIAAPAHERLLGVALENNVTGKTITAGTFHASPLTALNAIRREQIHAGLYRLEKLGNESPLLMIGDFNYPIFRNRLQEELTLSGYDLFTSDSSTYHNFRFVKGFFDFAAGKGFVGGKLQTLARGLSDHHPILWQAEAVV